MSRHFLIDGYNVLQSMPRLAERSLEDGRRGLLRFIQENRPQGSDRNTVTVVFDGREDVCGGGVATGDVRVVFSKGEIADDVIRRAVSESSRPQDITLVTDDRDLLCACRACGAGIWSVAQFVAEAHKKGERRRTGVTPSRSPKTENKTIGKVFEDKVNRELSDIWLRKRNVEKGL